MAQSESVTCWEARQLRALQECPLTKQCLGISAVWGTGQSSEGTASDPLQHDVGGGSRECVGLKTKRLAEFAQ